MNQCGKVKPVYHSLAVRPWETYLETLSFDLLISKNGLIIKYVECLPYCPTETP